MLLSALILTGYNIWDGIRAKHRSDEVLVRVKEIIQESSADPESSTPPEGSADVPYETEIPDYIINPDMDMPSVEIDGRNYVGILEIPSIGVELPVLEMWSYPGLKIAPGRYMGTPYKNNFIIAAHNYDSHFGHIKDLIAGDDIIFTDMDGNIFRYKVASVDTLAPTAVEEMRSGGWPMTLFTCTLGGQMRVTVRCNAA